MAIVLSIEKTTHNLKVENYVLFSGQNWELKPGTQPSQIALRDRSKDYCWLKKTRHLKLMNLALFYEREDARVWAHWKHSSDVHLSYPGPVACFSPSWIPLRVTFGGGRSGWGLGSWQPLRLHPEFPKGSPSGAAVVAWWLQKALFTDMAGNIFHSQYILSPRNNAQYIISTPYKVTIITPTLISGVTWL